jgi:Plasmid pRiA4b ORF-3-like protein
MKKKFERVFQFKVTLKGVKPAVWRRFLVPESYTFWDLHVAIQDVFGWDDYHLHEFELMNPESGEIAAIGIPEGMGLFEREILAGWKQRISAWFSKDYRSALYTYDFGDEWEHIVRLEKILPREAKRKYPVCVDGKRACPPEDCGGVWGYGDFLKVLKDPDNEEYEDMLNWVGGKFDPEHFDPQKVRFTDPVRRRRSSFEE